MEKFVLVRLIGGLGNQMFQYALGRALSLKWRVPLLIDKTDFSKYHVHPFLLDEYRLGKGATLVDVSTGARRLLTRMRTIGLGDVFSAKKFSEQDFHYSDRVLDAAPPVVLSGYWQSPKYFDHIRSELLADFVVKSTPSPYMKKSLMRFDLFRESGKTIVGLHFRRGDYVSNPEANKVHGTCDNGYYFLGIDKISEILGTKNMTLVIFSDEPEWVRENFSTPFETTYQQNPDPRRPFEDIELMARCDHMIIANSSFSWWGAWLGTQAGRKVIAPRQWFREGDPRITSDIYGDDWLVL